MVTLFSDTCGGPEHECWHKYQVFACSEYTLCFNYQLVLWAWTVTHVCQCRKKSWTCVCFYLTSLYNVLRLASDMDIITEIDNT